MTERNYNDTPSCQSVAEVYLTGMTPLEVLSNIWYFIIIIIIIIIVHEIQKICYVLQINVCAHYFCLDFSMKHILHLAPEGRVGLCLQVNWRDQPEGSKACNFPL